MHTAPSWQSDVASAHGNAHLLYGRPSGSGSVLHVYDGFGNRLIFYRPLK